MSTRATPPRKASPLEAFLAELHRLWNRAGRPSPDQMAKITGRPAIRFAFLRSPNLPTWDEVMLLLMVAKETDEPVVRSWRRRWVALDRERRRTQPQERPEQAADSSVQRFIGLLKRGRLTDVPEALQTALEATSPADFTRSLDLLRRQASKSYLDIAKASKGRVSKSTAHRMATDTSKLPKRSDTVDAFVRACGASETEAQLWEDTLHRLRTGAPPVWTRPAEPSTATSTSSLVLLIAAGVTVILTGGAYFLLATLDASDQSIVLGVAAAVSVICAITNTWRFRRPMRKESGERVSARPHSRRPMPPPLGRQGR